MARAKKRGVPAGARRAKKVTPKPAPVEEPVLVEPVETDQPMDTSVDPQEEPIEEVPQEEPEAVTQYEEPDRIERGDIPTLFVTKGRAISCKIGVIDHEESVRIGGVTEEHVIDGASTLKRLYLTGLLVTKDEFDHGQETIEE